MRHTAKKWLNRLGRFSQTINGGGYVIHRECPHCRQHTPWITRALRGFYRCTRCGQNPLDG